MCVLPVKIPCQLAKVYGVCVIPWKQADTVHGFQHLQGRCWQVVAWAPSMSTTDDTWRTDMFSCWHCQRARHSLGRAQNCLGPSGLQKCVYIGWQRIRNMMTNLIVWDCMGLSCIRWTFYTDQREHFWIWNMVNYTNPDTRKRMCARELSSTSSKEQ